MNTPGGVIAAFDFDGTLTTSDSVIPFLRRFVAPRSLARLVRYLPSAIVGVARRDRDRLRAAATKAILGGVDVDRLDREAAAFAAETITDRLRVDTTARLAWHRSQGHRVVLVSASYEQYLFPVADSLDVEAVLATRLQIVDGRCTGRLLGPNCRGPEKVIRLHTWLSDQGLDREQVVIWAYGDSAGDDALLADSDHPVRVDNVTITVAPDRPDDDGNNTRRDEETA